MILLGLVHNKVGLLDASGLVWTFLLLDLL